MTLHEINRGIKKYKKRKRVGRGPGSGHGKTSGRGHKGQGQLAGWSTLAVFQGGAMPLVRRVPKRGFNNQFALKVATVNVGELNENFADGETVSPETLKGKQLANCRYDVLKVLGDGELTKKLKISAHRFSKSAEEKIKKSGSELNVLPGKAPVVKNKMGSSRKK